jgi:2,3-bisphosphoglycerate-independent phosphoglycerate mutase
MEGMDLQLGRLAKAVEEAGAVMVITADHGNSDDMFEHNKKTGEVVYKEDGSPKAKTSHSLNPVPCIVYDPECKGEYRTGSPDCLREGLGISSIAASCIQLLGFLPPEDYDPSVLQF